MQADIILFVVVPSELDQLKKASKALGISFKKNTTGYGEHYDLGQVGDYLVVAVQTDMGPFGYRGSASQALNRMAQFRATAIIGLGMAFGVDNKNQNFGDILVATGILPYDRHDVRNKNGATIHDYRPVKVHRPKPALVEMCRKEASSRTDVHFGLMLSGGARIHCTQYRKHLVTDLSSHGEIVGGEMEGVGFLASGPDNDPRWLLVKGISDFADDDGETKVKIHRTNACYNAAAFLLSALARREP